MKTLPVAIFTHDRTACAMAVVDSLIRNLRCGERRIEWILCDDRSKPGHVAAVVDVFRRAGIEPTVHLNNDGRTGLGAAMNKGIVDAFGRSHECLRIEDDWLLKRPLDLGDWVEDMDKLSIGSLRLGMMFRKPHELLRYADGLLRVVSDMHRTYTFNNQVAVVTDTVYDLCGLYKENVPPAEVERDMAIKYNRITSKCKASPWVCWPDGWATNRYYDDTLPFAHVGLSTIGHGYKIPAKYKELNDPALDLDIRKRYLPQGARAS